MVTILVTQYGDHTAEFSWSCPHIIGGSAAFKFEFSISSVEGGDPTPDHPVDDPVSVEPGISELT